MPVWGRRESYGAVTATVAVLVFIGVLTECSRELIPPAEPNDIAGYPARFLSRAGRQGIEWRTTDDQPFAEAARTGKPVMVFAGTSASLAARKTDDEWFGNPEVWARLNRDFVCVRVDLATEPEWRGAFLPVLRHRIGTDPGFAVWFFKPNGQLLTWIGRREWPHDPDYNDFLGRLSEVSTLHASTPPEEWTPSQNEQHTEVRTLRTPASRALPDMDAFFVAIGERRPFFTWQAGRYRALLQAGYLGDARMLLKSHLVTPRADLVDGGLFRLSSGVDPMQVEFDKLAAVNAEMLSVFARLFVATQDPLFEYWYRRTVQCIEEQFMQERRWSSYVENAVGEDGRSARNSFGVAALRNRVGGPAVSLAQSLGLDARSNPLMAPYMADADRLLKDRNALDKAIAALQRAGDLSALTPAQDGSLDAVGIVVARTIEAAMLMDDRVTLGTALGWAFELRDYRAGTDEVVHALEGRGTGRKWLGDFAAYSEAMLQLYFATGEENWLRDGERVLRRAIELFSREQPGDVVAVAGPAARLGPLSLEMPSIVDDGPPPALPVFMSACFRYGAVLGDEGLRQAAVDVAERFSSVANDGPLAFSSFLAAVQEVLLTGCLVVRDRALFKDVAAARPGDCVLLASSAHDDGAGSKAVRYVRTDVRPAAP